MPKGHGKDRILRVRLNRHGVKVSTKAAKASEHKTLSGWIRHALRKATHICPS